MTVHLSNQSEISLCKDILIDRKIGIEKESLRVSESGISKLKHPESLGSSLCNNYITTDFSESQIEAITPPGTNITSLKFLDNLHHFIALESNEKLWPFSIPPYIKSDKDIPIASYGSSNVAIFKELYREGLSNRYGRLMQAISGIHFNFSFSKRIWELEAFKDLRKNQNLQSDVYFSLLRNVFRTNWIIIYLFGASPIVTKNFLTDNSKLKQYDHESYFYPYATSLRMSDIGYQNFLRQNINVSINSLDGYVSDLLTARNTLHNEFEKIDDGHLGSQMQISPNILQIEDEYYGIARPKNSKYSDESSIYKLKHGGVDYIELRSIDLNPFSRIGIDEETFRFIELFLIYGLFSNDNYIENNELESIRSNDALVATNGRDSSIKLTRNNKKISLKQWGNEILNDILPFAELLSNDQTNYLNIIDIMRDRINDPSQTISGKIMDHLANEKINFSELGKSISDSNNKYYLNLDKSLNNDWQIIQKEVEQSIKRQFELESQSSINFDDYLDDYFKI